MGIHTYMHAWTHARTALSPEWHADACILYNSNCNRHYYIISFICITRHFANLTSQILTVFNWAKWWHLCIAVLHHVIGKVMYCTVRENQANSFCFDKYTVSLKYTLLRLPYIRLYWWSPTFYVESLHQKCTISKLTRVNLWMLLLKCSTLINIQYMP